ncbi:Zinc finger, C2H2 [Artemisia annua]|uniref:Zinc finger, C2H2 n=1 Tax=Artemisia annua TaxID=35608 RepID=A0A2U1Q4G5_ARTAN|nr:Zinc finger, C2H2 [Artemisia annua]
MSFLNLHQPENDLTIASSSSLLSSLHNAEQRVFSCSYCRRKFYSPQAFGGHQNAHKLERTLAKKSRELSSAARHNSEWNNMSSRFDSNGSTHVGPVQLPVVVGVQHEQRFNSTRKGDQSVEDEFSHLDLSLRL